MPTTTGLDVDPSLRAPVEGLIAEAIGKAVTNIEIEPNGFSTKFSSFFVTAEFVDTETREFFAKASETPRSGSRSSIDRELRAYRDLSADDIHGASLIGTVDRADSAILLFERAPGWDLRYHDLDIWADAIADLARLHARFATRVAGLERLDYLVRYDADRCRENGRKAAEQVGILSAALGDRARSLVASFDRFVDELDGLPTTLVHGDLAPKNVVAAVAPPRITFVDWEWAGIGSALIDLVDLLNGLDDERCGRLVNAYRTEAAASKPIIGGQDGFQRALDLVSLERTIFRMSRSVDWGLDIEHIEAWMDDAQARLFALESR